MDQLPRLSARVTTLTELRDIVRAMRAMAAGAMREAEAALDAVRRYRQIMDDALADGLHLAGAENVGAAAEPRTKLLCVIGTEHGFVGNLNARLIREAVRPEAGEAVFVVGRRAAGIASEMGIGVADVLPMTARVRTIPVLARRVAQRMASADAVRLAFCRHRAGSGLTIVKRQIVPIADGMKPPRSNPPLHHLMPIALLRAFVDEYVMAELTRALTEAFVGENATRLRVLSAADRNIGDKIEELQRMARQLRQETITAELLDIVVGAEAVAESPGRRGGSAGPPGLQH